MAQFGAGPQLAAQCFTSSEVTDCVVDARTYGPYVQEVNVGDTVGKLRLVERVRIVCGVRRGKPRERIAFKCVCECGNEVVSSNDNLAAGRAKSCGCKRMSRGGMAQSPEYLTWRRMHARCAGADPRHKRYYKDRNITVDPRWASFENFLFDMGPKPTGMTLERKNNYLGYGPDNCKWATKLEQQRNKRTTRWIEIDGVRRTLSEWVADSNVPLSTVRYRILTGVDPKLALRLT